MDGVWWTTKLGKLEEEARFARGRSSLKFAGELASARGLSSLRSREKLTSFAEKLANARGRSSPAAHGEAHWRSRFEFARAHGGGSLCSRLSSPAARKEVSPITSRSKCHSCQNIMCDLLSSSYNEDKTGLCLLIDLLSLRKGMDYSYSSRIPN